MNYDNCPFYMLKSKRILKKLLYINDSRILKQDYIVSLIDPYIDYTVKPRLIEPGKNELKIIQKRIKNLLGKIDVPNNIFSGIKGRSYVDNALFHVGSKPRNLFKIDFSAFFPSISREVVYRFFLNDLCCSPDVACILTNLTTVNLKLSHSNNIDKVFDFLKTKNITCLNHLISGSPASQILSYLVNHNLFDEMQKLSNNSNITMTVYVDDVTFSSENRISNVFKQKIYAIIRKYNYMISKSKVKSYTKLYPKLITGVIIDSNGNPTVKNSIRNKIITEYNYLINHPDDITSKQRLRGLLIAAKQVDKSIFPNIYNFAYKECK